MNNDDSTLREVVKQVLTSEQVVIPDFQKTLARAREIYKSSPEEVLCFDFRAACYQTGLVAASLLLFSILNFANLHNTSQSHWTSDFPSDRLINDTPMFELEEDDWTENIELEVIL